ncbi:hypothetical protein PG984_012267 [Apiospora sp. TS-2023a]
MDPLSAISATLGVLETISQLKGLLEKYRGAPKQVFDTLQQCNDMESKLKLVREFIQNNQDALAHSESRDEFMSLLTTSTRGIKRTIRKIRKALPKIGTKDSKLDRWLAAKFVWNGDFFQTQLEAIKEHHNELLLLNSLITGLVITHGFANLERRFPTYAEVTRKSSSTAVDLEEAPRGEHKSSVIPNQNSSQHPAAISKRRMMLMGSLLNALFCRHSEQITALLRDGADIDARLSPTGERAIHIAARNGDMDSVRTLIRHAANMKARNDQGCTPLMVALQNARVDVSLLILERVPYCPSEDYSGKIALHYAAETNLMEPMMELIKMGANVNATDTQGWTPLHYSLQPKIGVVSLKAIRLLLDAGAMPTVVSNSGVSPLHLVAEATNQEEALRLLIGKAVSLDIGSPLTPLGKAALSGRFDSVRTLLDAGARMDPLANRDSALYAAFSGQQIDSFALILERGADPNTRHPYDPNKGSLLHHAAIEPTPFKVKAMQLLVNHPLTEIDIRDIHMSTPLIPAVLWGCEAAITLLLEHGANPMTIGFSGLSAGTVAASMGNIRILQLLYRNVSDRTMENMWQPFISSIFQSRYDSAAFFLGLGFQINGCNRSGIPMLHRAAFTGNLPGVQWLLSQGADKSRRAVLTGEDAQFNGVFRRSRSVWTAEDVARYRGHTEVAELLASTFTCPHNTINGTEGSCQEIDCQLSDSE